MNSQMRVGGKQQQGISLVAVIFLLAVVSILAVSMANMTATQHFSSAYSARAAQAYFAARAGIEYGIVDSRDNDCSAASNTFVDLVSRFDVTVECREVAGSPYNEGGSAYRVYELISTASDGGFQAPDAVNRRIRATVRHNP